ncbi:hypothetical protein EYR38_009955 [Pleurotus pulmonarius]|nr:hypothetical protein EYR38_009955 [Pleurotus pulmonarius]
MSLSPSKGPQKSAQHAKHLVLSSHNAARTHASVPTPSATAATPASKAAVIPQESGRVCPTCRVKVALSSDGACNECTALKKARIREGERKESAKKKTTLVFDPSAKHNKQKTLPMVSMDGSGGGGTKNVSSAAIESIASGHIDKKLKFSSTPATEVPNTVRRPSSQTQYQTDKRLYAQLRLTKLHSRSTKRQLNFTGSYSVIKDPKTRNTDLISTVFEAVKDRGCVRFKYVLSSSSFIIVSSSHRILPSTTYYSADSDPSPSLHFEQERLGWLFRERSATFVIHRAPLRVSEGLRRAREMTELQSLASETRRRHPEIREAAEKSLAILRSSPEQATTSLASDGPQSSDLLRPVFMGCATKNAKVVAISLGSLQRLIVLKAVPLSAVPMIVNTMTDAMSQGVDIQLKALQTLVSLITGFPEVHGELLGDALLLCFKLQESKIAVVSSTAAATLRQLVMFIVDKMVDEDQKGSSAATIPTHLPDGSTKSLAPSARDAFSVFEDLCLLANSEKPNFLKLESLHKTFALELIESVLTNSHAPIRQHDELILLLRHHLCPLLLKALSDRPLFPLTLRCTRVVFILLKQFIHELDTEAEVFLAFFIRIVSEEGGAPADSAGGGISRPQWMRVLAMEIIRGLCSDADLVRTIWDRYDAQKDASSQVLSSLVSALKRLITEKPSLLGVSSQMFGVGVPEQPMDGGVVEGMKGMVGATVSGVAGVVSMGMGMGGGGGGAGLSVEGSVMKVQCIDQLDKADAPPIPETYIYLLGLQSICTLCEGFSSFVTPLYNTIITHRSREAGESTMRAPPALDLEKLATAPSPVDEHTVNQLRIVQDIISSSWPALLASLSFIISTNISDGLFVDVVFGAVQGLINVSGILALGTPRDALFTSLAKFAIPARVVTSLENYSHSDAPLSPRVASSMSSIADLSGAGGSGSWGSHQPPSLSERNYACLKVLVNCAMFLAGSLGESWYWVLEVMQNAEYVITSKGAGISAPPMVKGSASKPGSRVVSMMGGSPQLGAPPAAKHPLLTELDGERLYAAIQRLFDSTTGAMDDEAFGAFVRALCKLSWEMVGMQSSSSDVHSGLASTSTLTLPAGAAGNESLESLSLSPNTEASHRRRASGIHIPRTLRSGDFGISKLLTVSLLNIHRLIYRAPNVAWEPTTLHLLSVIRDERTCRKESKEKLGAPQGIRIQAAKALDEILVNALKNLGSGIGMGDKKGEVQQRVLDVLGKQVILIPDGGLGTGGVTMVEVELRKMGLETLHEILQNSAHTLVVGWEKIFEMLGSVCLPSAAAHAQNQAVAGTGSVPSSPLMNRWKTSSNATSPAIGYGHPGDRHQERNAATLVKIAFQSLTLVCDSISSLQPDHLRLCIITLGQFGRQPDTNIALTAATSLLWGVSDAIQSKRKSLSDTTEPAYKTYSDLWLFLLGEILGLCISIGDERREVRDGAIQTLFRALMFYGGTLSLAEWEECVWGILVPLFEKLSTATGDATPSAASSPVAPTNAPSFAGERQQSWDDSKILAFHSLGSILHDFLAEKLIRLESFARIWDFLVARVQEAVLWDNRIVSSPSLRCLEKAIKAAGLAAGSGGGGGDEALSERVVDMCERAWKAFDEIGEAILQKKNEVPAKSSSPITLTIPVRATKSFSQESFVSLLEVVQRVREVERGIQAKEWELERLARLMVILKGVLTYSSSPDYRPDIDSLSPAQTSVMDTVNGIDLSAPTVSSLVMRDLSEYATLAFLAAFDVQPSTLTQTGPKRITYIALMKKTMPLLVDLYVQFKAKPDLYADGTLEAVISAYSIPIKMKYDCPPPSKFGKDPPLWKTATTNFLRVVKECLVQMNTLKSDIPDDRVEGIWRQIIDVFRGGILADCSASEEFPLDVQDAEENFDLALISSLEIDVLPYIGDSRVPDSLIRQLSRVLQQGSALYEPHSKSSASSSPITEALHQPGEFGFGKGGLPEGSYGSTDLGTPLPRERFSYWCLDLLFLMCSDFCKDGEPLRRRVAALSLPSLLNRCHASLASYVADEVIRGALPFPRAREEELLYILRKLLDLSLWPSSLWAAFAEDPTRCATETPHTTLPPSELVADAVKRSTVAHLFHMYDLLCDIAAIPRKPPSTWVSIPQAKSGSGSVGKPPIPTPSSQPPSGRPGESTRSLKLFRGGGVVGMDARTLARECLKVIGKELGVSR